MDKQADNSWAEYQKLVLAELERHNSWLTSIDAKLNQALLTFGLQKQALDMLRVSVADMEKRIDKLEHESVSLEDQKLIYDSLRDLRRNDDRIYGGLKIAAVVVPITSILIAALVDLAVSGRFT